MKENMVSFEYMAIVLPLLKNLNQEKEKNYALLKKIQIKT